MELIEIIRTALACYHEQEPHPYDEESPESVICELVHVLLERAPRNAGDLQIEVRTWMAGEAIHMTNDELRLRILFDRRDYRRSSDLRTGAERNPTRVTSFEREAAVRGLDAS